MAVFLRIDKNFTNFKCLLQKRLSHSHSLIVRSEIFTHLYTLQEFVHPREYRNTLQFVLTHVPSLRFSQCREFPRMLNTPPKSLSLSQSVRENFWRWSIAPGRLCSSVIYLQSLVFTISLVVRSV